MYGFPMREQAGQSLTEMLNEWGVYEFSEVKRKKYTHIFTHIRWDITCVWVKTEYAPFDAYTVGEIKENISLPTAIRQCLSILEK